jgi:hypothetical protein
VFDVKASESLDTNKMISDYYDSNNILDASIYNNNRLFSDWYQGKKTNYMMHFLVSITKDTFSKINKFDENYANAIDYDDNDFLIKIIANGIKPLNVFNEEHHLGGIHLYHEKFFYNKGYKTNEELFYRKLFIYNTYNVYIDNINEFNNYTIKPINNALEKRALVESFYKKK